METGPGNNLSKLCPLTLWFTGYSGAGKTTLAYALKHSLRDCDRPVIILDGDEIRRGLNRDLGFSAADRSENIRRVSEVSRLMNEAGLIVISALISPSGEDRESARQIIGQDRFAEVHINTPFHECEKRDPKGLYLSARSGEIHGFTGIDAPYDAPFAAALSLDTSRLSVADCVEHLLQFMRRKSALPK